MFELHIYSEWNFHSESFAKDLVSIACTVFELGFDLKTKLFPIGGARPASNSKKEGTLSFQMALEFLKTVHRRPSYANVGVKGFWIILTAPPMSENLLKSMV